MKNFERKKEEIIIRKEWEVSVVNVDSITATEEIKGKRRGLGSF